MFFKVMQYDYQTLQNVNKSSTAKTFNMELNVSLISNKAPNVHPVICSEMNNAFVTKRKPVKMERGSYKFMFFLETVTFYCKTILQLIM